MSKTALVPEEANIPKTPKIPHILKYQQVLEKQENSTETESQKQVKCQEFFQNQKCSLCSETFADLLYHFSKCSEGEKSFYKCPLCPIKRFGPISTGKNSKLIKHVYESHVQNIIGDTIYEENGMLKCHVCTKPIKKDSLILHLKQQHNFRGDVHYGNIFTK